MRQRGMVRAIRRPKVWAMPLACAGALWWGAPRTAEACSCAPKRPPAQAKLRADAVFEGRVYGIRAVGNERHYSFDVDRLWKGELPDRVTVTSNAESSACGRTFELGRSYVVYANGARAQFRDNMCSRTRPSVAAAEDLAALGEAVMPAIGQAGDPVAVDPGAPPQEPPRLAPPAEAPAPIALSKRGCAVAEHGAQHHHGGWAVVFVLAWAAARRRR